MTSDPAATRQASPVSKPPAVNLAAAAGLWLWGALALIAPTYVGFGSPWNWIAYGLGPLFLVISFAGALIELSKLFRSEGLSYWGVSLVFLIPAAALFLIDSQHRLSGAMQSAARLGVIVLVAVGGFMLVLGVPYLTWTEEQLGDRGRTETDSESRAMAAAKTVKAGASALVALLALATAVATLVEKLAK